MLKEPEAVRITHLFPELLANLLALLGDLPAEAWARPTACPGWTVKDVATHLLGSDVGILSRRRDGYTPSGRRIEGWQELVALINRLNAEWVTATRRLSPRLLVNLLQVTGEQVTAYFHTLDPVAMGDPVSWAGPDPAPVWLDLAREYTERWLHQQHIRLAVEQPVLTARRYLEPVLATFVHALPRAYRDAPAIPGTAVRVEIGGEAGGSWTVRREDNGWKLYAGQDEQRAASTVRLPAGVAWRLFTKGMEPDAAVAKIEISGDQVLGGRVLEAVAIIA